MAGLGTTINVALIVAGGTIGLVGGRLITPRIQEGLMKATGVSVVFIGLAGALEGMPTIEAGSIAAGGTMVIVTSLPSARSSANLSTSPHGSNALAHGSSASRATAITPRSWTGS